jgi:DNA-damage-inducible protein D
MNSIKLFEDRKVRSHWNEAEEQWYFSVVDVVEILTDSPDPKDYWYKMKKREKVSGIELSTICRQLKMESTDGKRYSTDCSNIQGLLRIIQSIPSPKAEPFKRWLAKVGYERMQEIANPEQGLDRARENWHKLGRSEKWIQQRMTGQETRNKLTDYWKDSGVKEKNEFAILTNIIHQEWTGLTVKKHKDLKGLKTQNLRDHMTEAELIFTALAELSTRQIAEKDEAKGLTENTKASKKGGAIAKKCEVGTRSQNWEKSSNW